MVKQRVEATNNIAVFPNRSAIKEEAGTWIVCMDEGSFDDTKRQELLEWIQRSDFHREYLLKLAANWDSMAALEVLGEMFPLPEHEPLGNRAGSYWPHWLGWLPEKIAVPALMTVALSSIFAVVLLAGGLLDFNSMNEFSTVVGERAEYTLSDGTVVSLNTDSKLRLDYSGSRRAAFLIRGEANFTVAKNPERPFVVYAGNGLVWAVGTAFNVRYIGEAVDVTVTEGRVKVFSDTLGGTEKSPLAIKTPSPAESGVSNGLDQSPQFGGVDELRNNLISDNRREALIGAGQSLRYEQTIESLESIYEEESARKLAWKEGDLIFKGETLQEAIAEIARYTKKKLILVDPSLGEVRVGGHYKTDDINALLDSLGQGLDINIRYTSDNRVLLSANRLDTR